MLREEKLREIADAMIEESTTKYLDGKKMSFVLMLNGVQKYKLEAFPGAGHNYQILLEQIYEYYKNNPNIPMDEILYAALLRNIQLIVDFNDLNLFMNYIYEQLDNERKNVAPFKIDNVTLLTEIKKSIISSEKIKNDIRINEWLNNANQYLETNYGHKM